MSVYICVIMGDPPNVADGSVVGMWLPKTVVT